MNELPSFVHIAKTGGTSLRRLLKSHDGTSHFDCFHNGFLLRFENGRCVARNRVELNSLETYDVAVITLRHPLSRLQSCYHYFLSGGLNGRGRGDFPDDRRCQEYLMSVAPTFSACVQKLDEISAQIPHFYPASYWFDSLNRSLGRSIFSCRQESFASDVNGLFKAAGVPLVAPLEHRNQAANLTHSESNISQCNLRSIQQFYSVDYARFGYDIGCHRSLPLLQYWNDVEPPVVVAGRMEKCKNINPSWNYLRFNKATAYDFLSRAYGYDIAAAFLDIRLPAMQADVFRVAFLLHCGGLWIDAATSLLRPVESWMDRQHSFQMLRRSYQRIRRFLLSDFASRPGLPLLKAAWDEMVPRLLSRSGRKVYRDFGPGLFRDLLASRPNLAFGLHVVPESLLMAV